ncbi:flagellar FliL protein [Roseovarius sp. A-2]|uniref:flagellar basal body-associated FliL family protein n=1 Tax=Roseovarius sp. A-2 TaxID=1570360 RepID=UPI0009B56500|nr:flagellar basal body-associated FliL family protein [Roseovarius sp. A-2]GAW36397.1 flagellar FliL protein [Roseovarius sp. A-2]
MADEDKTEDLPEAGRKRGKWPLMLGLGLALVGGGAGFYAATSGLLPFFRVPQQQANEAGAGATVDFGDVVFVPVEPLVISLSQGGVTRHLRFRAELEVDHGQERDVTRLMPRIVDVLNTYLRALSLADIEERAALLRLRAQMLRRVQIVAGAGRINDLLVMEFVLN